ncbi:MAG: DUF2330 domain-containing protein [candidate division WOR-3 bacterium]
MKRVLFLSFLILAYGDKGLLPLTRPDISLYTPAQRAIILWNGKKEVLILSTNVSAQEKTKALEILPLPSVPEIKEGDFSYFEKVFKLIRKNSPLPKDLPTFKGKERPGIEIIFKKEIGPHNITTVRANDYKEFKDWTEKFLKTYSLGGTIPERLADLIGDYLRRGIKIFAFDLIDLTEEESSLKPLIYEFSSPKLYFPLLISNLSSGKTEIQLFVFAKGIPAIWFSDAPLDFAYYERLGKKVKPIIFKVAQKDFGEIFPQYRNFFSSPPYFTSLHYSGDLTELKSDLNFSQLLYLKE